MGESVTAYYNVELRECVAFQVDGRGDELIWSRLDLACEDNWISRIARPGARVFWRVRASESPYRRGAVVGEFPTQHAAMLWLLQHALSEDTQTPLFDA